MSRPGRVASEDLNNGKDLSTASTDGTDQERINKREDTTTTTKFIPRI